MTLHRLVPALKIPTIPKDHDFDCYICGMPSITYRGLRTVPPDPHIIHRVPGPIDAVIERTSTCGSDYCEKMEERRMEAIFSMLIAPEREKYFAERAARLNQGR